MLQILTTDEFAEWFDQLADRDAEDVATALDVVEQLGPHQAPPGSRESLLWYEHESVAIFGDNRETLAWDLEEWGGFRDYARQVLAKLESPRFADRLAGLSSAKIATVMASIRKIRRAADPRFQWALRQLAEKQPQQAPLVMMLMKRTGDRFELVPNNSATTTTTTTTTSQQEQQDRDERDERDGAAATATAEIRRAYFEALEAAGFNVEDLPAHSRALRELTRRVPGRAFRLLYGVDVATGRALIVLGEWLEHRSFYGDSVRKAEKQWRAFLDGDLVTTANPASTIATSGLSR
jgi:hypothetical protein